MIKQCAYCGKEFDAIHKSMKYCSEQCRYVVHANKERERYQKRKQEQSHQKSIIKQCPVCGKTFETSIKASTKVYCSIECNKIKKRLEQYNRDCIEKECPICKKKFMTYSTRKICCSKQCNKEYVKIRQKNRPDKKRFASIQHCKKRDCLYSPPDCDINGCDYCYLTGNVRGCDAENCTRYVKSTQKERDKFRNKILWRGFLYDIF